MFDTMAGFLLLSNVHFEIIAHSLSKGSPVKFRHCAATVMSAEEVELVRSLG